MLKYRLKFVADDDGTILVTSPDFPLVTSGANDVEAVRNAEDATLQLLQSMIDNNDAIPAAPMERVEPALHLAPDIVLKVALHSELRASGMSRLDVAEKLDWSRETIDRLFQLRRKTRSEDLAAAFLALDKVIDIQVSDLHEAVAA